MDMMCIRLDTIPQRDGETDGRRERERDRERERVPKQYRRVTLTRDIKLLKTSPGL